MSLPRPDPEPCRQTPSRETMDDQRTDTRDTGAKDYAFGIVDTASIELRFDESGSYGNSLLRIPERYVCLWPECEVTCKRVYELKRHVNRHKPRRCWYCPISGCKFASDFRRVMYLWSTNGNSGTWTTESVNERTHLITLLGFSRLDKLRNHLQKEHSEFCNDLGTVESLIGPKPEPVAPIVLKVHMTRRGGYHKDDNVRYHNGSVDLPKGYYVVEVTEINDAPTQETTTTLDRVPAQPDDAPTELVDTTSPPANGSSIGPFPAPEQGPEQGFLNPYLDARMDATNAGYWVHPSDPQQTTNASSISPFAAPEQGFMIPYLDPQVDATNAGNWDLPSDPEQTANTSSISPFPAPEPGFLDPFLDAEMDAMNAGSWIDPSDPQQTANTPSIGHFPAPEQSFLETYLEAQVDVTNAIYWDLPFDPQQTDDFTSYLD